MPVFFHRYVRTIIAFGMLLHTSVDAQSVAGNAPRVVIPTGRKPMEPVRSVAPGSRVPYPWKTHVTATIFWCGEQPTARNPTPNCKSSWDTKWAINFGGYDDPDPKKRIANHATGEFRPKDFVPKLNPFYIALPYNDVKCWKSHKPEASKVIPWFSRVNPKPGKTVLKGRWVQIFVDKRSCFAQWEDCGPWVTDDWQYVFGGNKPKATQNGAAGIDISPSIRDYLGVKSGQKVHWRFVEESQVPYGPWKKYGNHPPAQYANSGGASGATQVQDGQTVEAQRAYLEYLRKRRDEQFMKKPLSQL